MNVIDALPDSLKKSKGRPKGSGKLTMAKYADAKPLTMLPKTENQRVKELKDLLINSAGVNVVQKTVQIALDDDHPAQMAALKLCMDRMLPVTLFEKEKNQRSAVNITISGIGGVNIDTTTVEAEDIESKDV
jgi:predicted dinucleotide-utilizing enzyme